MCGSVQVTVSEEFQVFMREQLDRSRAERRQLALDRARRGLAQNPVSDVDAISVPDDSTPDISLPPTTFGMIVMPCIKICMAPSAVACMVLLVALALRWMHAWAGFWQRKQLGHRFT